jgi:7 transmembrane sweet-taste receptor of 3 GCPR
MLNAVALCLESTFVGTSGNIVLNPKTGTRNASSSRFSLLNFVEDTTTSQRSSSGKVNLTSVLSKYFEGDVWLEKQQFIFNDGTMVAPRDLPEVELDSNYLGTALRAFGLTMAACVLLLSLGWALWTYKYREQRVVRASQPIFLQIICFGTFLLGSSIIPLSVDDEHSSTRGCDIACMAFPWLSSCGFCIAFSALFTKTHRVNMIFKQARFKRVKVSVMEVMVPLVALLGGTTIN